MRDVTEAERLTHSKKIRIYDQEVYAKIPGQAKSREVNELSRA